MLNMVPVAKSVQLHAKINIYKNYGHLTSSTPTFAGDIVQEINFHRTHITLYTCPILCWSWATIEMKPNLSEGGPNCPWTPLSTQTSALLLWLREAVKSYIWPAHCTGELFNDSQQTSVKTLRGPSFDVISAPLGNHKAWQVSSNGSD